MIWLAQLLIFSAPVAYAALGETVLQRAGMLNIGLEGNMLLSAFFGFLVAMLTGNPWIGLAAGATCGVLVATLLGVFSISLRTDQIVTGMAINLLAFGLTATLFRIQFGQSGQLVSVESLPRFGGFEIVSLLLVPVAILLWWMLHRTGFGLLVRAAGNYPPAVEAAGSRVSVVRWRALLIAGLLGGLGGAYLAVGVTGSFAEGMTAARGFVAIAMVTFGRWNPILVLGASLLIGAAESLQFFFQAQLVAIPYQLLVAFPYVIALVVLVLAGRGTLMPSALGKPYER
ncbi:MAG: ABC transporter permease [Fimbriimonadaceae bacterium]